MTLVPQIRTIRDAIREHDGCILARMSGSGGTVFGLFGTEAQAHQAAHDLRDRHSGYWVAAAPLLV
jgi:4-diphosphocytidyl-2-C-methyl-D-erythritol kinase